MESISGGMRYTADQIAESVREYGRSVVSPPADLQLNVVKVEAAKNTWSVYVPVFTKEEGRSDLTLEVTLTETGKPLCDVEIDGLHVL